MKKFLSIALSTVMLAAAVPFTVSAEGNAVMRDISTMELVKEMGIGINLGNTLESCGDWIADVDQQWGDGIGAVDKLRKISTFLLKYGII
jgi:endoglucanase